MPAFSNCLYLPLTTDTLSCQAPTLTLENVYEVVKRARDWRGLGDELLLKDYKLDAIQQHHGSDEEACLKAVIEAFLHGEGRYKPSWRIVIWALYKTGESHIAHDIITYAEPVQGECYSNHFECVCVRVTDLLVFH